MTLQVIRKTGIALTFTTAVLGSSVYANAQSQNSNVSLLDTTESSKLQYSTATAFETKQTDAPMVYVIEQSLPDFLRQAARRNGYQINISSRVRGVLKKMSLPLDIKEILKTIAPQFDLKWHFQQQQIFVSVSTESTTRLIFLGNMKMENLESALSGAGLTKNAYDISYVEESNSVIVNAPVSYIASVELIAEAFNKNKKAKKDRIKIIKYGNVSKP